MIDLKNLLQDEQGELKAKREAVNTWIRTSGAFDGVIGLKRLRAFHVNDSRKPLVADFQFNGQTITYPHMKMAV